MEQVNYKVFELNGVSLPLDVDDMNVNRRIDAALVEFQKRGPEIDALKNIADKAYALVDSMRNCINFIFGDETAADKYFGEECRLSALNRLFNDMAYHIGAMRATAYNAASMVFTAANAARVLKPDAEEAAPAGYQGKVPSPDEPAPAPLNVKYMGKPYNPPKRKSGK